MRHTFVLALALVLAGCGGGGRARGTATLWVTENRGAHVVFSGDVGAGLNGIQTVERKLKVSTRYGGRYLQSIDGIAGSLSHQRDWFFYVNGLEGDRSAAEVKIHPGDLLWWDYRHWTPSTEHIPVVAGAWPRPFTASTSVVANDRALARRIARQVHGVVDAKTTRRNFVLIGPSYPPNHVRIYPFRKGYVLELGTAIAKKLAADPHALRYRF
ncbi:MAG TPA: DUF4430 domain-containing protein [Gaiellaceae bacterium]